MESTTTLQPPRSGTSRFSKALPAPPTALRGFQIPRRPPPTTSGLPSTPRPPPKDNQPKQAVVSPLQNSITGPMSRPPDSPLPPLPPKPMSPAETASTTLSRESSASIPRRPVARKPLAVAIDRKPVAPPQPSPAESFSSLLSAYSDRYSNGASSDSVIRPSSNASDSSQSESGSYPHRDEMADTRGGASLSSPWSSPPLKGANGEGWQGPANREAIDETQGPRAPLEEGGKTGPKLREIVQSHMTDQAAIEATTPDRSSSAATVSGMPGSPRQLWRRNSQKSDKSLKVTGLQPTHSHGSTASTAPPTSLTSNTSPPRSVSHTSDESSPGTSSEAKDQHESETTFESNKASENLQETDNMGILGQLKQKYKEARMTPAALAEMRFGSTEESAKTSTFELLPGPPKVPEKSEGEQDVGEMDRVSPLAPAEPMEVDTRQEVAKPEADTGPLSSLDKPGLAVDQARHVGDASGIQQSNRVMRDEQQVFGKQDLTGVSEEKQAEKERMEALIEKAGFRERQSSRQPSPGQLNSGGSGRGQPGQPGNGVDGRSQAAAGRGRPSPRSHQGYPQGPSSIAATMGSSRGMANGRLAHRDAAFENAPFIDYSTGDQPAPANPKAAHFPQTVAETHRAVPGTVFPALEPSSGQFRCYQKHSTLKDSPNKNYPLGCQACHLVDNSNRLKCVFCNLRLCYPCARELHQKCHHDLQELMAFCRRRAKLEEARAPGPVPGVDEGQELEDATTAVGSDMGGLNISH